MRNKFERLKNKKSRTVSSNRWLLRHINDSYVKMSSRDGYRSRSAYKIIEINEKFKIINKDSLVVDLGAAPGGWSQVIGGILEDGKGLCVAVDLLEIEHIRNVVCIKKDFYDNDIKDEIRKSSGHSKFDVVLSDMSPNTTGIKDVDHIRIMNLCESAFMVCEDLLKINGTFVCKTFQGGTENLLLNHIKLKFKTVKHFKPKSSRSASKEMYLIALGFKGW